MTYYMMSKPPAHKVVTGSKHLSAFCDAYGLILYDRFGAVEPSIPMVPYGTASHKPIETGLSYAEICDGRAKWLLNQQRPIKAFWSGGIDSTTMLVAFFRAGASKDQIDIATTWHAVVENYDFFRSEICGKGYTIQVANSVSDGLFDCKITKNLPARTVAGHYIVVDGEHNDQVFGSDVLGVIAKTKGFDKLNKRHTIDEFSNICSDLLYVNKSSSRLMYIDILSSAKAANVVLETIYDVFWWLNFSFKWQNVALRSILRSDKEKWERINPLLLRNSFFHFFDIPEFQNWSITRAESKIGNSWKTYKAPAKKYIYEYDRNLEYFENAAKVGSLMNINRVGHGVRPVVSIKAGPFSIEVEENNKYVVPISAYDGEKYANIV